MCFTQFLCQVLCKGRKRGSLEFRAINTRAGLTKNVHGFAEGRLDEWTGVLKNGLDGIVPDVLNLNGEYLL